MGQTPEGAKKAYQTQLKKYGIEHFHEMRSRGGKQSKNFTNITEDELREISSRGGKAKKGYRKDDNPVQDGVRSDGGGQVV